MVKIDKESIQEKSFNLTKNEWLKEINEALLKLGIQLCDSQGYYRSIYSLFDELSEKWHLLKENTDG